MTDLPPEVRALTARAARWCAAAGIPPPREVRPYEGDVHLYWGMRARDRSYHSFWATCETEGGGIDWLHACDPPMRHEHRGADSASLIAAIKEAVA